MANLNCRRSRYLLLLLVSLVGTILVPVFASADYGASTDTDVYNIPRATTIDTGRCDETKCRAPIPGTEWFRGYCWSKESILSNEKSRQTLCEEGYEARSTTDETIRRPEYVGEDDIEFTCCPRGYGNAEAVRHCDSSVCRDSYLDCVAPTGYGYIEPLLCEKDGRFRHPNFVVLAEGNFLVYTCCETPDGILAGPYVKNAAFYWLLVPSMVLSIIIATALSVFIASILASPKTRSESFNLYLVFVAVPDLIFNAVTVIIYSLYLADVKEQLRSLGEYFMNSCSMANILINIVICYELYKMVMSTHNCQRVVPPTAKRILWQCCGSIWIAFGFFAIHFFFVPYQSVIYLYYIMPVFNLGGMVYIIWAYCRMRTTGMLSVRGRTRFLALYFGRILLVFFCFWFPTLAVGAYNELRGWDPEFSEWPHVIYMYLITLQGPASCAMAMTKRDIAQAVKASFSKISTVRLSSIVKRISTMGLSSINSSKQSDLRGKTNRGSVSSTYGSETLEPPGNDQVLMNVSDFDSGRSHDHDSDEENNSSSIQLRRRRASDAMLVSILGFLPEGTEIEVEDEEHEDAEIAAPNESIGDGHTADENRAENCLSPIGENASHDDAVGTTEDETDTFHPATVDDGRNQSMANNDHTSHSGTLSRTEGIEQTNQKQ